MAGYAHTRHGFDSQFGPDLDMQRSLMKKMDDLVDEYYELLDRVQRWDVDITPFTRDLPEYFVDVLEAHESGSLPSDRALLSFRKKLNAMNNILIR